MQLYWKNTNADGLWGTVGNWWEDEAGTETAHGSLPTSGDSCSYATGETAEVFIAVGETVNLGVGSCGMRVTTNNGTPSGEIAGGTFTYMVSNNGTISGGTFSGCTVDGTGNITGGTFDSDSDVTTGEISGGSFGCTVAIASGIITDGTFTATSEVSIDAASEISGGIFNGDVQNSGTISGGTFGNTVSNLTGGAITGGGFNTACDVENTGTISGGTFAHVVLQNGAAEISAGTFEATSVVTNVVASTISGGTFSGSVDNTAEGTITGGTFGANFTGKVYFTNAVDTSWDTAGNWFCNTDDPNRTAVFSARPTYTNITIGIDIGTTVVTGPANCTCAVRNDGTISAGNFANLTNYGTIEDCTIGWGVLVNDGVINGGLFTVYDSSNTSEIYGGVFLCTNFDNTATIDGGIFTGTGVINSGAGTINRAFWWKKGWMKLNGTLVKTNVADNALFTQTLVTDDLLGGGLL